MIFATSGSQFFIGSARPGWQARTVDASEFLEESWVEVKGITSLGRVSGEWDIRDVTLPDMNNPAEPPFRSIRKAVRPASTMQIVVDTDAYDPGQLAMFTAEAGVDAWAFRLLLPGAAQRLFVAHVVSAEDIYETANSPLSQGFSLVMQSNVVRI